MPFAERAGLEIVTIDPFLSIPLSQFCLCFTISDIVAAGFDETIMGARNVMITPISIWCRLFVEATLPATTRKRVVMRFGSGASTSTPLALATLSTRLRLE